MGSSDLTLREFKSLYCYYLCSFIFIVEEVSSRLLLTLPVVSAHIVVHLLSDSEITNENCQHIFLQQQQQKSPRLYNFFKFCYSKTSMMEEVEQLEDTNKIIMDCILKKEEHIKIKQEVLILLGEELALLEEELILLQEEHES